MNDPVHQQRLAEIREAYAQPNKCLFGAHYYVDSQPFRSP